MSHTVQVQSHNTIYIHKHSHIVQYIAQLPSWRIMYYTVQTHTHTHIHHRSPDRHGDQQSQPPALFTPSNLLATDRARKALISSSHGSYASPLSRAHSPSPESLSFCRPPTPHTHSLQPPPSLSLSRPFAFPHLACFFSCFRWLPPL